MAEKAPFTLTRVRQQKRWYWYALFRDPETGCRMNRKSVEVLRDELFGYSADPVLRKSDAAAICVRALDAGYPKRERIREINTREYLTAFYDAELSHYFTRKLTLDPGSVSKDYMATRKNLVCNHVIHLFPKEQNLSGITLTQLEDIQYELVKKGELARSTINMVMQATLFALKEAQRRSLIPSSVSLNIRPLKSEHRIRGILTDGETQRYLAYARSCSNPRIWLSAALSLVTGMRSGELRGLTVSQIKESMIVVDRAYADLQGVKSPKGKRSRVVPCPPELCTALREFARRNPKKEKNPLVFWSARTRGFVSSHYFSSLFKTTMTESGIMSEKEMSERNISFHSFRHMANTLLRGSIDEYLLRLTIGHTSTQLSDIYTHVSEKTLKSVSSAQKANILPLLQDLPDSSVSIDSNREEKESFSARAGTNPPERGSH